MEAVFVIDSYKLMHWLNVRKLTPALVADSSFISVELLDDLIEGSAGAVSDAQAKQLADALDVDLKQLAKDICPKTDVIYASHEEILNSRRPIERDGIHFYNYYTLPSPKGHIAPVILDILCPKDRLPQLNNGHLEPAITVNIGPGDIHGRWGEELNDLNWQVLEVNKTGNHEWIVGGSYVEPAYCPHTYSLVSHEPAQIISYTCKSNLEAFLKNCNNWSNQAFEELVNQLSSCPAGSAMLRTHLERRGYNARTLAGVLPVSGKAIAAYLEGDQEALTIPELKLIGTFLGVDYRLLIPPAHRYDGSGKTCCSVVDSIATVRPFKSYTIASMASAPQLPDLVGMFVDVDKPFGDGIMDLMDHGANHYVVTRGQLTLRWTRGDGTIGEQELAERDSLWVGSYVSHAFFGRGSLIKLGNGEGCNYLDQMEMTNTFNLATTLKRGRKDRKGWGYDSTRSKR
jgi:2-hydroxyethylphosphonate dioxygenase